MFTGLSGKTWVTTKIAHESHSDVRRIWGHAGAIFVLLAELGLRKPPRGNPEGLAWQGRRLHLPASAVVKQSPWIGGKYSRVPWYSQVAASSVLLQTSKINCKTLECIETSWACEICATCYLIMLLITNMIFILFTRDTRTPFLRSLYYWWNKDSVGPIC